MNSHDRCSVPTRTSITCHHTTTLPHTTPHLRHYTWIFSETMMEHVGVGRKGTGMRIERTCRWPPTSHRMQCTAAVTRFFRDTKFSHSRPTTQAKHNIMQTFPKGNKHAFSARHVELSASGAVSHLCDGVHGGRHRPQRANRKSAIHTQSRQVKSAKFKSSQ